MNYLPLLNFLQKLYQCRNAHNTQGDSKCLNPRDSNKTPENSGFTLIELIVVVAMVGIFASVAGVSWQNYSNSRRTVTAAEQAMAAIRSAQAEAIRTRQNYAINFSYSGTALRYARYSYSSTTCPTTINSTNWDTISTEGVSFSYSTSNAAVGFDYQGNPCQLGTWRFVSTNTSTNRRCVKISTLIGAMRLVDQSDSDCNSN
jgi:type II secretion system protein H